MTASPTTTRRLAEKPHVYEVVETAEFSPDGDWILTARASDGTVGVWDANAGGESIVP